MTLVVNRLKVVLARLKFLNCTISGIVMLRFPLAAAIAISVGCGPEPPAAALKQLSLPKNRAGSEIGTKGQQEVSMIERVDPAYQKQALQIAEKKLVDMGVPFRERVPSFQTVVINEKHFLEIRYSSSHPNARAGDWVLCFDPNKPIDANPVDIKIWR